MEYVREDRRKIATRSIVVSQLPQFAKKLRREYILEKPYNNKITDARTRALPQ